MPKSVLTLGTFDGVHRGHQRIIKQVVRRARELGLRSVALCFKVPPRLGHRPRPEPVLLSTLADKVGLLKRLGIQHVDLLTFNHQLASMSPEDFFKRWVIRRWHAAEMIVGPRVAFGKNRAGKLPELYKLGHQYGVRIRVVPAIQSGGKGISSSGIRHTLVSGDVEKVRRQLGYPYSVSGRVIHGESRGRKLGYPTANIEVSAHKILPPGVFWVKCLPSQKPMQLDLADLLRAADGLCNVGTRPTFTPAAKKVHCEVYLLKRGGNLYGKKMRVVFLRRIRAERRFDTPDALKRQIDHDLARALKWSRASR